MRNIRSIRLGRFVSAVAAVALVSVGLWAKDTPDPGALPAPVVRGRLSLEECLARRRSVRRYADGPLTRRQIAQLCWAAQGVTEPKRGFRTAPSAGGLFPLELYVVTAEGVWRYVPKTHSLVKGLAGDVRGKLQAAALGQPMVGRAPATFVIAAVASRTARKYGPRSRRYVDMEVGHAGQNLLLQATALGLGAVPAGAFHDDRVRRLLSLPADHEPLYLIPVGPLPRAPG